MIHICLLLQLDYEDTSSILVFGGGGAVALWLAAAVVGAVDSIPLVSNAYSALTYFSMMHADETFTNQNISEI